MATDVELGCVGGGWLLTARIALADEVLGLVAVVPSELLGGKDSLEAEARIKSQPPARNDQGLA